MIDNPQDLNNLIDEARATGLVALDTEFVWEHTYYPKLGLIQLGFSADSCHLIDTLALEDLSPLGDLLADPSVEKILHDAQQDLTILRRATGAYPRRIFDTRCAAAFAGHPSTLSLRDLLDNTLNVQLDKTETRTNWLLRPLSQSQCQYAYDDVRHLPELRNALAQKVCQRQRTAWLEEEMAAYNRDELYQERDPNLQYERIRGGGRISPRDRAVLRELAAWREEEAMVKDKPRQRIMSDATLLLLARRKPQSTQAVARCKDRRLAERYGEAITARVERALALERNQWPQRPKPFDHRALNARLDQALAYVRQRCEEEDLDSPFVATRAEIKILISEGPNAQPDEHRLLRGWRHRALGDGLIKFLANGADEGA